MRINRIDGIKNATAVQRSLEILFFPFICTSFAIYILLTLRLHCKREGAAIVMKAAPSLLIKKCGEGPLRSPQMEYTRFPRASGKPPRALPCGVLPISFIPLESRIFHLL